jgi:integration host factor subunit beta
MVILEKLKGGGFVNRSDLINKVKERFPTLPPKDLDAVVREIFESMKDALVAGDRIELRGFGTFEVRTRDPRNGRNPRTGEKLRLTKRKVPFFRAGKELKEIINHG